VLMAFACAGCGTLMPSTPEPPPAPRQDACATARAYGYAGNVTPERNTAGCKDAQYGPKPP